MSLLFVSNSNFSDGLSGGDRIFLELLRRWQKEQPVALMGAAETQKLLDIYDLKNIPFYLTSPANNHLNPTTKNVLFLQLKRTFNACSYILRHHHQLSQYHTVYSVSDFPADFFPALLLKLLSPKTVWIAGYYLNAPNPFSSSSPYNQTRQFFKGLIYFLSQIPTKIVINLFANFVFVTSQPETQYFPHKKTIIIRGGVDTTTSTTFFQKHSLLPLNQRKYSACFMGRLHPQKGVLELIDIWKIVTQTLPDAKLAIIGDGQLKSPVVKKIKQLQLSKNIVLFGFLDGPKKEAIFRQSCLILHPATYDSGGMASAEAMAWGLPGVSFDLEALKTYYPQGMVKVPCYDLNRFAQMIIKLLQDQKYYQKMSTAARQLIVDHWDWDHQAATIYHELKL